jgi:hypothetical protein
VLAAFDGARVWRHRAFMLRRVSRAVAVLALLAGTRGARADEEVVELRYHAPAECPARSELEAAILERTPNVRLAAPARRVFAITIEATGDGFRGALVVDRSADKELAATRCDDLAAALALVTALAIDPTATARFAPIAPPGSIAPSAPPPRRLVSSLELDAGAMIAVGVGPEAMFAAVIEARASVRDAYQLELAVIAGRDTAALDGARARFSWLASRGGGCRRGSLRGFDIDGCAHLSIGAVRASGEQIINQRDLTRLWLAAGLHGGAQHPLGRRGFGLLQVGVSLPLVRDRYLFAPNVTIHETPVATGWVVVGIGMRFL